MSKKVLIILALVLTAVLILACGEASTSATTVTGTVTSAPQAKHFKVGDQVKASNWLVVVNSVTTSTGDQVFTPNQGNIFVVVDISMTNLANSSQDANIFDYVLRGTDGTKYDPAVSDLPDLTGTIEAGGKTHGQIAFEVPQADKTFTLEWSPSLGTDPVIWDISL